MAEMKWFKIEVHFGPSHQSKTTLYRLAEHESHAKEDGEEFMRSRYPYSGWTMQIEAIKTPPEKKRLLMIKDCKAIIRWQCTKLAALEIKTTKEQQNDKAGMGQRRI